MRIYEGRAEGFESRKLSNISVDINVDNEKVIVAKFFVTETMGRDMGLVCFTLTADDVKLFQAMIDSAEQFRKGE